MNLDQLHNLHSDKLIKSFGVSTSQAAFRDDRVARALGNPDEHHSEPDLAKVEY